MFAQPEEHFWKRESRQLGLFLQGALLRLRDVGGNVFIAFAYPCVAILIND